jgi:hypothetical protein
MWDHVRNKQLQLPLPVRGVPHAAWGNRKTEPEGKQTKGNHAWTLVAVYEKKANHSDKASPAAQTYHRPQWEAFRWHGHGVGKGWQRAYAVGAYIKWTKELREESREFLQSFKDDLQSIEGRITDEQKRAMRQQLDHWLTEQRNDLAEQVDGMPRRFAEQIMKQADWRLDKLGEKMWDKMEKMIDRHNGALPPVDPPPIDPPPVDPPPVTPPPITHPPIITPNLPGLPADGIFKPGTIQLDVTKGAKRATLTLRDLSADRKGTALFYVMDAVGNRKAVSVTFNDSRLQSEFERRFRESSMYGKTVSLEKFNRFIRRLKASLEEITDTDLERLRSRLFEKEESAKLDNKIRRFIGIVYQMKW